MWSVHWVRSERSLSERGVIATFNIDQKSGRELRQYLSTVATQCCQPAASGLAAAANSAVPASVAADPETTQYEAAASSGTDCRAPAVIILDNLQHVGSPTLLADAFTPLLGLPLHDWYRPA